VEDTAPVVTVAAGRRSWPRWEAGGTEKGAPELPRGDALRAVVSEDGRREEVRAEERGEAPVVMTRDSAGRAGRGEWPVECSTAVMPGLGASRGDGVAPAVDSEAPAGDGEALAEEADRGLGEKVEADGEGPPRRMGHRPRDRIRLLG